MAFPATQSALATVLQDVQGEARALKSDAQGVKAASLAAAVSADLVHRFHLRLIASRDKFTAAAAVPGIAQFARDQLENQSLDIVAEFNAMVSACNALAQWVVDNFPSAGGYAQKDTYTTATPGVTVRTFSVASLVTYRLQLDTLINAIN